MALDAGGIVGIIFAILIFLFLVKFVRSSIIVVKEKEVVVLERLGTYKDVLTAGIHFVIWPLDKPKKFYQRYYAEAGGHTELRNRPDLTRISTQNEVIDFPKQCVITRDNAMIYLDAVLSYKVVNPKLMIYSCVNIPYILSKLVQAQLRNVAGNLDVDQIIEDSASLNVITGLLDQEAARWGIKIVFVKIQRIDAGSLTDVLGKKKNADLKNKEVIISSKAHKQTMIIEAEGKRDSMIKEAEGEAQETLARARGQSQAVLNSARAEAQAIREVARAVQLSGENPVKYLISLKYMEALRQIMGMKNTSIDVMPQQTALLQTAQTLGVNTVLPRME